MAASCKPLGYVLNHPLGVLVGKCSPEVEICLVYYSGLTCTISAYIQNVRNDRISASFHEITPSYSLRAVPFLLQFSNIVPIFKEIKVYRINIEENAF